jgi:hypothetical protein
VVFRGYIDESFDNKQNIFAWSCVIARDKDWREMERKWKLHLNAKNHQLKKLRRPLISRYHASDCSGCRNEFKGWSRDERDEFVKGLFTVFKYFPCHTAAFDMQLDEMCEVFPEWTKDRLEAAYGLLTIFLMQQLGADFTKFAQGTSGHAITLFHDRTGGNSKSGKGKYDPTILKAFNRMIADPDFAYSHLFTTIAPMSWENCVPLQPADLVAFECYKFAEAKLAPREVRRSFTALVGTDAFGIHYQNFPRNALVKMREQIEAQGKIV